MFSRKKVVHRKFNFCNFLSALALNPSSLFQKCRILENSLIFPTWCRYFPLLEGKELHNKIKSKLLSSCTVERQFFWQHCLINKGIKCSGFRDITVQYTKQFVILHELVHAFPIFVYSSFANYFVHCSISESPLHFSSVP